MPDLVTPLNEALSVGQKAAAMDAADLEIPFPHQVAVPYGEEQASPAPSARGKTGRARASDPSPGDAHQDSGSEG